MQNGLAGRTLAVDSSEAVPALAAPERRAIEGKTDVRTTAIRGTAAAVLLSATVLGLAGCVNAEKPAAPGAGNGSPSATRRAAVQPAVDDRPRAAVRADSGQACAHAHGRQHNQTDVTFTEQAVLLRQQALPWPPRPEVQYGRAGAARWPVRSPRTPCRRRPLTTLADPVGPELPPADSTNRRRCAVRASCSSHVRQGHRFDMHWLQFMRANLRRPAAAVRPSRRAARPQVKQLAQQWAAGRQVTELSKVNSIG